jgi:hypothetical protein
MASQWRQQGLGFEALSIYFVIDGGASLEPHRCPPSNQRQSRRPHGAPRGARRGARKERWRAGAREEKERRRRRCIRWWRGRVRDPMGRTHGGAHGAGGWAGGAYWRR